MSGSACWAAVGRCCQPPCTDACCSFCGAHCSTLPSPTLQLHPTLSYLMQFAVCLSSSEQGGQVLGPTAASSSSCPQDRWAEQSTARLGCLLQWAKGGYSPPAREGNPSLSGVEFVLQTSVISICNSLGGERTEHMDSDPALA